MSSFDKLTDDKINFINSIFPGLFLGNLTYRQLDDLYIVINAAYSKPINYDLDSPKPVKRKSKYRIRVIEWLDD